MLLVGQAVDDLLEHGFDVLAAEGRHFELLALVLAEQVGQGLAVVGPMISDWILFEVALVAAEYDQVLLALTLPVQFDPLLDVLEALPVYLICWLLETS